MDNVVLAGEFQGYLDGSMVSGQGLHAARSLAGQAGRFYWETDTKSLVYDDGTNWNLISGSTILDPLIWILGYTDYDDWALVESLDLAFYAEVFS